MKKFRKPVGKRNDENKERLAINGVFRGRHGDIYMTRFGGLLVCKDDALPKVLEERYPNMYVSHVIDVDGIVNEFTFALMNLMYFLVLIDLEFYDACFIPEDEICEYLGLNVGVVNHE